MDLRLFSLINGFTIIASIVLIIRQLLPFIGETIITSSITFTLLIVSWYYGNTKIHKDNSLTSNFKIIAIILGIGNCYLFLDCIDLIINQFFNFLVIETNFRIWVSLFIFLSITIIPLGYYLGKSRIVINNFSILGILIGSILVPVFLMKLCGIATSIFIITLLWILLSLVVKLINIEKFNFRSFNIKNHIKIIGEYILLITIFYYCNIYLEKQFFLTTNTYANYRILEDHKLKTKIFNINQSPSSQLDEFTHQGFKYLELIKKILFKDLKLSNQKILILGAGGFSFTANGDHGNHITYVDLDPDLPKIVNKYFNKKVNYRYKAIDAGLFVKLANQNHEKYKVILSDVFSSKYIIPNHILDLRYITNIKNILDLNGIAIFNIIANPNLKDQYSKNIDHKIRTVFNSCMVIPVDYYIDQVTNILYICNK